MTKNHLLLLIERLEEILTKSPRLAGRSLIMVDEAFELLEKIRIALPAEIQEAEKIIRMKEEIIQQAREEADKLITRSTTEAKRVLSEHHLTKLAEEECKALKAEAYSYARQVEKELSLYVQDILGKLEENLIQALKVVHRAKDEYMVHAGEDEASENVND